MSNIKILCFLICVISIYTTNTYAVCSKAVLYGNYSYQARIIAQATQCQTEGNWVFNGNGGGWDETLSSNCPGEMRNSPFRYELDYNCIGRFQGANGYVANFQLASDGSIRSSLNEQVNGQNIHAEAVGIFNHPLKQNQANVIQQGLDNWNKYSIRSHNNSASNNSRPIIQQYIIKGPTEIINTEK